MTSKIDQKGEVAKFIVESKLEVTGMLDGETGLLIELKGIICAGRVAF